jgi:hypothetical protein
LSGEELGSPSPLSVCATTRLLAFWASAASDQAANSTKTNNNFAVTRAFMMALPFGVSRSFIRPSFIAFAVWVRGAAVSKANCDSVLGKPLRFRSIGANSSDQAIEVAVLKRRHGGRCARGFHRIKLALSVSPAAVASRDDLCAVAVLDGVSGKEPDGRLVGGAAEEQVGGAGQDFIVAVGPHDFEWEVFWQHGSGFP